MSGPVAPAAFPSLRIARNTLTPLGPFAEAQAAFLQPDARAVQVLDDLLRDSNVGVVAHFYMDPELQGVLSACKWPHVHISDSLVMADRAVDMAKAGVHAIFVAGVDFMAENVRAVLDHAGFAAIPVYRLAAGEIGCSLAASAEAPAYAAFLRQAAQTPNSLHVVYINTSLRVKAHAHRLVPTLTCTSSNVVRTILQATSQVADLHIWFGPDTYMGENLRHLFIAYAKLPDDRIRALHPAHDQASIQRLLQRFHPFQQGNCIVHQLFGPAVAQAVRERHSDALITAHLEVPGELFALASQAAVEGRGVVGSTSDILGFILDHVKAALRQPGPVRIPVVLGTEAGLMTSIVLGVQAVLRASERDDVTVEIVFPVAAEAATADADSPLGVIPGAANGEGCSTAGGCATCPYMRMNHLDGLLDALRMVGTPSVALEALKPHMDPRRVTGQTVAELGSIPILHMREFQRSGRLGEALVAGVTGRMPSRMSLEDLASWPMLRT